MGEAMSEVEYDAADRVLAEQEIALDKETRAIILEMQRIADMLLPGSAETDGQETRPTVRKLEEKMDALEAVLNRKYEDMHAISKEREELFAAFQENKKRARMQR